MLRSPARLSVSPIRRKRIGLFAGLGLIAGLSIAGPSGLFAWGEAASLREDRIAQLATIDAEREALKHRVALLNSDGADPDLVSELIRKNLNVVHPDEVVLELDDAAD